MFPQLSDHLLGGGAKRFAVPILEILVGIFAKSSALSVMRRLGCTDQNGLYMIEYIRYRRMSTCGISSKLSRVQNSIHSKP